MGFTDQDLGFMAGNLGLGSGAVAPTHTATAEREFFIENLLVQIHSIIEMIWWTGLAPWEQTATAGASQPGERERKVGWGVDTSALCDEESVLHSAPHRCHNLRSGFWFRDSGFWFLVSGFGFRVSGLNPG